MQKLKISARGGSAYGGKNQDRRPNLKNIGLKHFTFWIVILIFDICILNLPCCAQDITFEVTVDRNKISMGSSVQLNLDFYGTQDISAPELPGIDGFDCQYLGPSTRISIINGRVSNSITHMYRLIPLKTGKFTIPSFSLQYKGKTYTSKAVPIEVTQSPLGALPERGDEASEGQPQSLEDRIFAVIEADKTKAYVNEMISLTVKLFINELAIRDIQYPGFEHDGFSAGEYQEPKKYREIINGVMHDVIEFNTEVFSMRSGELTLGPAVIECNLVVKKQSGRRSFFNDDFFNNFFDRYDSHPLAIETIYMPIKILDLPQEDVPENFNGALGDYNFYAGIEPKDINVGDPITLKMTIVGKGNLKTVKPPVLDLGDDFKSYEPEVSQAENIKTFKFVLIPKSDKITEVPQIKFSFFDTGSGSYKTISRGPTPIRVNSLPEGEELRIFELPEEGSSALRRREVLGRDIIFIKEAPGKLKQRGTYLYKNKLFIAIQVLPLLAVISILILQRRKERLETDIGYARRLCAPRKARKNLFYVHKMLEVEEKDGFFAASFKTLQEYLGDKFHLPSAGITENVVEDVLRPRNIDKDILNSITECFSSCDTARYAPSSITKEQMARTYKLLEEIIDRLERVKQ
ncbi:MAG: protein BatD [Candidatus Omnitrophica bacterium]|nr:protein BatD [Candidatus Omnitrophota bacterium]